MRRFYFTNEDMNDVADDYCGNIRGARTYAQKIANERHETIIINDCRTDNIEDFVDPDTNTEE